MQVEKIDRTDLGAGKDKKIANADFSNQKLSDINGKDVLYENCIFSASIIERGYFFHAKFKGCKFIGTRFAGCNFRQATFDQCTFDYADFNRCVVPVAQLLANLPSYPNVRWELLHNLRANGRAMGDTRYESKIVAKEIEAEIEHWRSVRLRPSGYYEKYDFSDRLKARWHSFRLICERYIWGHGESLSRLFIATMVALSLLVVAHFVGSISEKGSQSASVLTGALFESISFVLALFVDLPTVKPIEVSNFPILSAIAVIVRKRLAIPRC